MFKLLIFNWWSSTNSFGMANHQRDYEHTSGVKAHPGECNQERAWCVYTLCNDLQRARVFCCTPMRSLGLVVDIPCATHIGYVGSWGSCGDVKPRSTSQTAKQRSEASQSPKCSFVTSVMLDMGPKMLEWRKNQPLVYQICQTSKLHGFWNAQFFCHVP